MDQQAFDKRTLDFDDGLDPMRPVSFPHVGMLTAKTPASLRKR